MKFIGALLLLAALLPAPQASAYWACFSSDGKIAPLDGYGFSKQADAEYEAMGLCRSNARSPRACRILCCTQDHFSFPKIPVKDRVSFCSSAAR